MKEITKTTEIVTITGYNEKGNGTFLHNGTLFEIGGLSRKTFWKLN